MNFENEQDEDLIPVFKCIKCGGNVCKDGVSKRFDGFKCVCIDCDLKEVDQMYISQNRFIELIEKETELNLMKKNIHKKYNVKKVV